MRTTIELPDSVYRKGEKVARTQGVTIEEFIIRTFDIWNALTSNRHVHHQIATNWVRAVDQDN